MSGIDFDRLGMTMSLESFDLGVPYGGAMAFGVHRFVLTSPVITSTLSLIMRRTGTLRFMDQRSSPLIRAKSLRKTSKPKSSPG